MNYAQTPRKRRDSNTPRRNTRTGCRRADYRGLEALVVDDDPITRKVTAFMLAEIGFTVRTAEDGMQALEEFSRATCDFALVDFQMPAINGYQLGRKIKSRHSRTRVVIMTGLSLVTVAGLMGDGSIDGWLFKPFRLEELENLLEQVGCAPGTAAGHRSSASNLRRIS